MPPALVGLVMTGAPSEMVMTSGLVSEPEPLVAVMLTLNTPTTVGVPVMAPVAVFSARPAGSADEPKLCGWLVATMV